MHVGFHAGLHEDLNGGLARFALGFHRDMLTGALHKDLHEGT